MKWGRYIKRTAARRVVWIVVGLAVYALLGALGEASAQDLCRVVPIGHVFEYRGEAVAACWADAECEAGKLAATRPGYNFTGDCEVYPDGDGSWGYAAPWVYRDGQKYQSLNAFNWNGNAGCPSGTTWDDELKQCMSCANRSPGQVNINTNIWGAPPEICDNGCTMALGDPLCTLVEEGPNTGYWCNFVSVPTGAMCTGDNKPPVPPDAPEPNCAAGEVRLPNGQCSPRGQCPVGQHEVNGECHPLGNCPPYHVKAPDGSCTPVPCPFGQARGNDGTCKADGNSDGTPDEEGPEGDSDNKDGMVFSGGQSCSVPPTCSGDPIMCGQARIQWQIECNTRRAESVEGGNACDIFNMPICIGDGCDPVQHKQLIIQWESMCALRELVSQDGDGEGDGGGDLGGIKDGIDRIGDFLDGGGNCLSTEEGCEPVEVPWDDEEPQRVSWSSGLSSTGTCPAPVSTTVSIAGYSAPIEFSYQPICDFAALMRWVLITAASIVSGFIVAGLRSTGGGT